MYTEKNQLLNRGTMVQTSQISQVIPKPKGSVGAAGFSLISAMKLDKHNSEDKALYNDILVSMEVFLCITALTLLDCLGICPCARNRHRYRS